MVTTNNWFGEVPTRPLSIFRIAFGLLLLKVGVYYLFVGRLFLSDAGYTSRETIRSASSIPRLSLLYLFGEPWQVTLYLLIWLVIVALLIIGYKTRTVAALNFVLLLSIHNRNPFILDSADDLMRLLSFWMIFIPLAKHYSVDAWLEAKAHDGQTITRNTTFAFPVKLIQLQIVLLYFFTGLFKLISPIWLAGDGIWYALQIEPLVQPTGALFFDIAPIWLLKSLNYYTIIIEVAIPFLFLMPYFQPALKAIGIAGGTLLHAGIGVLMAIPNFTPLMLLSYLLFFEDRWIVWLLRQLGLPSDEHSPLTQDVDAMPIGLAATRGLMTVCLGLVMLGVLWWNISGVPINGKAMIERLPGFASKGMYAVGLNQSWRMFSPTPTRQSWWIAVIGTNQQSVYDLRSGERLQQIPDASRDNHWLGPLMRVTKYQENLGAAGRDVLLDGIATYYCQGAQETAAFIDEPILGVQVIFIRRPSVLPDGTEQPTQYEALTVMPC